ncbi:MAG: two-component system chemotaxis response regulator CheY [Pirellulaceae bacterium]|jgi:two-component system chemotaxis response regulator CheY
MKILIVDDSRAMRMIVKRTLVSAEFDGLTFIEAANGIEALERIEADSPDLVLSDWNMPKMSGIELLDAVRDSGNDLRFVFITSESSPETKAEAEDAGAECVITKPFTVNTMCEALEPLLA